jgi:hypothetical protein
MRIVKRVAKWLGVVLAILVLLGVAQIAWGIYREPIAKKEATDFCATVKVGQSTDGIQERAIASGALKPFAKWKSAADGAQTMFVIYIGMPPFSRHICSIKATNVVISAEYVYMD